MALKTSLSSMMRTVIHTEHAPKAIGPYSQAIRAHGFLFVSGQLGMNPKTMTLEDGGVQVQARRALDNMKAILEAGGSSLDSVVKTTVLLRDMSDFAAVNQVYSEYFPSNPPARACYAVANLPLNALVEIECVAAVEERAPPKASL
eukprot:TRINITY_DN206_c0_g2_i2.p3 TRINITY_DN206_c0_g2~~TRINITY_DN206_c0_g2_i2.p3  ORF type:complete len:146 (-),score=34.68 TRINITY_DN206_c0_g2_i2:1076-1513(-)